MGSAANQELLVRRNLAWLSMDFINFKQPPTSGIVVSFTMLYSMLALLAHSLPRNCSRGRAPSSSALPVSSRLPPLNRHLLQDRIFSDDWQARRCFQNPCRNQGKSVSSLNIILINYL